MCTSIHTDGLEHVSSSLFKFDSMYTQRRFSLREPLKPRMITRVWYSYILMLYEGAEGESGEIVIS